MSRNCCRDRPANGWTTCCHFARRARSGRTAMNLVSAVAAAAKGNFRWGSRSGRCARRPRPLGLRPLGRAVSCLARSRPRRRPTQRSLRLPSRTAPVRRLYRPHRRPSSRLAGEARRSDNRRLARASQCNRHRSVGTHRPQRCTGALRLLAFPCHRMPCRRSGAVLAAATLPIAGAPRFPSRYSPCGRNRRALHDRPGSLGPRATGKSRPGRTARVSSRHRGRSGPGNTSYPGSRNNPAPRTIRRYGTGSSPMAGSRPSSANAWRTHFSKRPL